MLEKITAAKRLTIIDDKKNRPLTEIKATVQTGSYAFGKALTAGQWGLIAECKLASPAKGQLCSTHTVPQLAQIYTDNGAAALSVHTDQHFCGRLSDITAVRAVSSLPILRKDFIIDEYQIYEARAAGADGVLLIAAVLSDSQLREYLQLTEELGMDALVEVHGLEELLRVQQTPARLIGINNRDLKTFCTDVKNTFDLLPYCDDSRCLISESGVSGIEDAARLRQAGIRGILVGEGLVKASDIAAKTRQLAMIPN